MHRRRPDFLRCTKYSGCTSAPEQFLERSWASCFHSRARFLGQLLWASFADSPFTAESCFRWEGSRNTMCGSQFLWACFWGAQSVLGIWRQAKRDGLLAERREGAGTQTDPKGIALFASVVAGTALFYRRVWRRRAGRGSEG